MKEWQTISKLPFSSREMPSPFSLIITVENGSIIPLLLQMHRQDQDEVCDTESNAYVQKTHEISHSP